MREHGRPCGGPPGFVSMLTSSFKSHSTREGLGWWHEKKGHHPWCLPFVLIRQGLRQSPEPKTKGARALGSRTLPLILEGGRRPFSFRVWGGGKRILIIFSHNSVRMPINDICWVYQKTETGKKRARANLATRARVKVGEACGGRGRGRGCWCEESSVNRGDEKTEERKWVAQAATRS